jgi:hypothetical protein
MAQRYGGAIYINTSLKGNRVLNAVVFVLGYAESGGNDIAELTASGASLLYTRDTFVNCESTSGSF